MKYIRTKDGIYVLVDYLGIHDGKRYALMDDVKGNRITMCQEPEELHRLADTIEELCDDFVLVAPYRFKRPKTAGELDKDFEEMRYFYTDKDDTIYGSIWDGPTLKAVAKWNREQGEWDLL